MPWIDFFDSDGLSGKGNAEIDLLALQAKTSADGDHDGAVVERVVRFGGRLDGIEQAAQQTLPDLACAPVRFLRLGSYDGRFHRFG